MKWIAYTLFKMHVTCFNIKIFWYFFKYQIHTHAHDICAMYLCLMSLPKLPIRNGFQNIDKHNELEYHVSKEITMHQLIS